MPTHSLQSKRQTAASCTSHYKNGTTTSGRFLQMLEATHSKHRNIAVTHVLSDMKGSLPALSRGNNSTASPGCSASSP